MFRAENLLNPQNCRKKFEIFFNFYARLFTSFCFGCMLYRVARDGSGKLSGRSVFPGLSVMCGRSREMLQTCSLALRKKRYGI